MMVRCEQCDGPTRASSSDAISHTAVVLCRECFNAHLAEKARKAKHQRRPAPDMRLLGLMFGQAARPRSGAVWTGER